jgi:hypothetical protein
MPDYGVRRGGPEMIHVRSGVLAPLAAAGVLTLSLAAAHWPALADEGHSDEATVTAMNKVLESAGVEPEPEPKADAVPVTLDYLVAKEREIDPHGSPNTFVCGNAGDPVYTVVMGGPDVSSGLKPDPNAEPRAKDDTAPLDPCTGMDFVVGRGK